MSVENHLDNPLWPILVETVHSMVMYPHHRAFIRDVILYEKPDSSPQEVAMRLRIPLGEALVILHELRTEEATPLDRDR